jgi:hypothetical protein
MSDFYELLQKHLSENVVLTKPGSSNFLYFVSKKIAN